MAAETSSTRGVSRPASRPASRPVAMSGRLPWRSPDHGVAPPRSAESLLAATGSGAAAPGRVPHRWCSSQFPPSGPEQPHAPAAPADARQRCTQVPPAPGPCSSTAAGPLAGPPDRATDPTAGRGSAGALRGNRCSPAHQAERRGTDSPQGRVGSAPDSGPRRPDGPAGPRRPPTACAAPPVTVARTRQPQPPMDKDTPT
jgi:hypothetical protein